MNDIQIYYLISTVLIWLLGYFHNGKFVRPKWKIPGKFFFYVGVSFALVYWFKHWALLFIIGHPLIGFLFHLNICSKHSINWRTCEPRDKYLALQEKWAKGDFS
jgi:hypothetical protein